MLAPWQTRWEPPEGTPQRSQGNLLGGVEAVKGEPPLA